MEILNDLLDVSRLESGLMPVSLGAARIGTAIVAAIGETELAASDKGVALANHVAGSAADLLYWGDEGRVRQILVNLLTNAVKYTAGGGRITISAGRSDVAPDL